eukprot:GHVU01147492.1.p1 GENE.GHVU01147492.1~~GHVU01147492.1.p1  ORF type:complete len:467 (+),score=16.97 GHVU01147492.1:1072-2472(+)
MECPSPMSIKRPDAKNNADRIQVPCGNCEICLSNRRAEWSFRLNEELRSALSACFVTITYDPENIPITKAGQTTLNKRDVQLFLMRLRKQNSKKVVHYQNKKKVSYTTNKQHPVRYYLVGEYGSNTLRPHYHAIIFNLNEWTLKKIDEIWKNGFIHVGKVTPASIHYTTKYMINKNVEVQDRQKPFQMMSKNPGIGSKYVERTKHWHKSNLNFYGISPNGGKTALPRYYKEKIFNKYEIAENSIKSKSIKENSKTARMVCESVLKIEMADNYWDKALSYAPPFRCQVLSPSYAASAHATVSRRLIPGKVGESIKEPHSTVLDVGHNETALARLCGTLLNIYPDQTFRVCVALSKERQSGILDVFQTNLKDRLTGLTYLEPNHVRSTSYDELVSSDPPIPKRLRELLEDGRAKNAELHRRYFPHEPLEACGARYDLVRSLSCMYALAGEENSVMVLCGTFFHDARGA